MTSKAIELAIDAHSSSLESYLSYVRRLPILSWEEEQSYAHRYQSEGDLDAARSLVLSHLRVVVRIARGYLDYGLPFADIIQEGNIGLMKAVKHFKPDYGVRLVSFAIHWIRAEIHEYILRNWRMVKLATTKAQRKLFFNLRKAKKRLSWLKQDEAQEIAEDLQVPVEQVLNMDASMTQPDQSLDETLGEESNGSRIDQLSDTSPGVEENLVDADYWERTGTALNHALEGLDERSRGIIEQRWLADEPATLQGLADQYGVSAERIRQLEHKALKSLRDPLSEVVEQT